jgi:hypothetical protein
LTSEHNGDPTSAGLAARRSLRGTAFLGRSRRIPGADGELTVDHGSSCRFENDERRSEERRWCGLLSTRSWNQIWSWLENIEKSRPLLESVIR